MNFFHGQKSWTYSFDFLSNLHNISLCNVALTVKRELYYAMLYIGKSENEIGCVQLSPSLVVRQSLSNCYCNVGLISIRLQLFLQLLYLYRACIFNSIIIKNTALPPLGMN